MDDIAMEYMPDESEQLDQLQPADSLIDRGVEDVLDEGYVTPEKWSPAQGFGNTPEEMHRGETLEMRMKQEEPEPAPAEDDWNPTREPREVGAARAGRLMAVQAGGGTEHTLGVDVGFGGGAASAEEAAMHIISEDEDDLSLLER
ncbi:DUF5709 domain-containing protein [Tessaracoccus sp. MC1679]|uniref:DUF5709 domain-containing protein n=1 Tax=Tessaracoccus sp. MC1679 TaxID=2760313 RepID=UPI001600445D|nr:DUF5709 domain-containing protein [Tessaracoccus sp. MC1679]MBB1515921.1 hypothetical protein [Tessaracoccus sp. MC1679]